MEKTAEEILTEIYKRSLTHIEGFEKTKLTKLSMFMFSEVLEAMEEYKSQSPQSVSGAVSDEEINELAFNLGYGIDINSPKGSKECHYAFINGTTVIRDRMQSLLNEKDNKLDALEMANKIILQDLESQLKAVKKECLTHQDDKQRLAKENDELKKIIKYGDVDYNNMRKYAKSLEEKLGINQETGK